MSVPTLCRIRDTWAVRPWTKLGERLAYDSRVRPIVARTFELPDGSAHEYEVKLEGPVVAVLALTREDEVVLAREFRVGPEDVLLELPGGALDDEEDAMSAAERELLEETGYSGEFRHVATLLDCAYSTRVKHVVVCTSARAVGQPHPHDGEWTEAVLMPLAEFREHLRSGRLTDVDVGYRSLDALGLL